ncbi:unnamed protein product [Miscanthus lutarioriparius]|uniref:Uncharacterized protein n=1 Tax=Miscanthus lutarioriparius TaxID=422564 RepID=A0A811S8L4_9POAL|nr:unnamed protein product [Miscanthus lutarioriparius]
MSRTIHKEQRLPGGHGTIANVALTQKLPPEVAAAKDQQYMKEYSGQIMKFWAGLQKEVDKEMLIKGVDTMIKIALQLLSKKHQAVARSNLLPDPADEDDAEQEPDC